MIFNRSNSLEVLLLKEGKRYINGGKRNSPRKETSRKNKNKNTPFWEMSASLNCLEDFPNAVYKVNAVKLSSKSYNKMPARVASIVIDFQYHKIL